MNKSLMVWEYDNELCLSIGYNITWSADIYWAKFRIFFDGFIWD